MDRIVEQLVRKINRAVEHGDEAARLMLWERLMRLASQPGFLRAFDRALHITNWQHS